MSADMEVLRKDQKMLEIKNTVTEMKNAFDGLISRLDMAEESVSLKIHQYKLSKVNSKLKEKTLR